LRAILGGGSELKSFLRGAWTQLHQTWPGHKAIIAHCIFVSEFGYLAAFSNAGGVNLSVKRRQILHFLTPYKVHG